jgi:flagellar hook-associated protein 3 FlgL
MRLSTNLFYTQNETNISEANSRLYKLQQQLSTGKKLQQPSDDPLAATQINKFERIIARNETFTRNAEVSERRLNLEETTLTLVADSLLRIKDLAIQANNGSLSQQDLGIIAEELSQLQGQVASALNTQDAQGEYLFAGFKGSTQPYQQNATGEYEYRGDNGQRFLDIGENATIASTDPGGSVFGGGTDNILNSLKNMVDALNAEPSDLAAFNTAREGVNTVFEDTITLRSKVGARLNVLEDQKAQLADINLYTQQTLSSYQDTDYYQAISQLSLEQSALEAAYSSFGKIQQLSLFNYVN